MIRRKNSKGLFNNTSTGEDVNPMETTANLADVMLVLAVGMMLAVVINWNVDLNKFVDVDEIDASELKDEQVQEVEADKALEEKGMVYQDPDTGKYYIKVEE